MNPVRTKAYLELLLVSVIWGVAGVIIKYTLGGFSPFVFLTYRFFISTVLAIFIFIIAGIKIPKDPRVLGLTIFNGFLISTASLGLLFLGANKTTSIDLNLISAMAPIMIAAAGIIFLKEHVTGREKVGIAIAFTGTIITIIEPILKMNGGVGALEGNLIIFVSVLVSVASAVLAKKVMRNEVDALTATNLSFIVGFITILPFGLPQILTSRFQILSSVPLSYHLGVFYMALLSGTLAYYLWHKAEKSIEVSEVNLIAYLYPVFGTPLSVLWLKEKITLPFMIGSIIIAIGVILAQWKKKQA